MILREALQVREDELMAHLELLKTSVIEHTDRSRKYDNIFDVMGYFRNIVSLVEEMESYVSAYAYLQDLKSFLRDKDLY